MWNRTSIISCENSSSHSLSMPRYCCQWIREYGFITSKFPSDVKLNSAYKWTFIKILHYNWSRLHPDAPESKTVIAENLCIACHHCQYVHWLVRGAANRQCSSSNTKIELTNWQSPRQGRPEIRRRLSSTEISTFNVVHCSRQFLILVDNYPQQTMCLRCLSCVRLM